MWMFIEGLHIYKMIIPVLKRPATVKISLLLGYGIPLVILGLSHLYIYIDEDLILCDINSKEYFL